MNEQALALRLADAIEKRSMFGAPSPEQIAWISAVSMSGGRAGVARNEDDLEMILRGETDGTR